MEINSITKNNPAPKKKETKINSSIQLRSHHNIYQINPLISPVQQTGMVLRNGLIGGLLGYRWRIGVERLAHDGILPLSEATAKVDRSTFFQVELSRFSLRHFTDRLRAFILQLSISRIEDCLVMNR